MRMQVDVEADLAIVDLLLYRLPDRPDRWLAILARIDVVAVQILTKRVQSVVTTIDAVRVEHRHHFEHEVV